RPPGEPLAGPEAGQQRFLHDVFRVLGVAEAEQGVPVEVIAVPVDPLGCVRGTAVAVLAVGPVRRRFFAHDALLATGKGWDLALLSGEGPRGQGRTATGLARAAPLS